LRLAPPLLLQRACEELLMLLPHIDVLGWSLWCSL
jgi:hypothetical protein